MHDLATLEGRPTDARTATTTAAATAAAAAISSSVISGRVPVDAAVVAAHERAIVVLKVLVTLLLLLDSPEHSAAPHRQAVVLVAVLRLLPRTRHPGVALLRLLGEGRSIVQLAGVGGGLGLFELPLGLSIEWFID